MTRARRFCTTYRWEIMLFVGIPFTANALLMLVSTVAGNVFDAWEWYAGHERVAFFAVVRAALLALCYRRVRRQERELLSLVWGYALFVAIVNVVVSTAASILAPDFWETSFLVVGLWSIGVAIVVTLAELPVLAWYARRASRLSLTHAYFLFAVMVGLPLGQIVTEVSVHILKDDLPPSTLGIILSPVSCGIALASGLLLAWLLGRFEGFSPALRKRVVAGLLAANILLLFWDFTGTDDWGSSLVYLAVGMVSYAVPLALIYRVREKRVG